MAFKNKIIHNPITKQEFLFLQTAKDTGGKLLEMESTYHAQSTEPPAHYHPQQEEFFTVLEGELTVRLNGELRILKRGDMLHVPANKIHAMWNASETKTVVNWKVQPAMNTEYFIETITGLANDGKTNKDGQPAILQVSLIANKFSNIFRLTTPTFLLQRVLFTLLAPIAFLSGYKPVYKKYLD